MTDQPSASIRAHAALDLESRRLKAEKVAALLGLNDATRSLQILEIGCGSGAIAHYLAALPVGHTVKAVDVYDSRVVTDGYEFQTVKGTKLPFEEAAFDVVISNHVIEHVGERHVQESHLAEIRRVLTATGIGYLATPNRWRLIEPHFRLPLLSVFPKRLRNPYLRLAHRGTYDCFPLSARELERMIRKERLGFRRLAADAIKATVDIEGSGGRPGRFVARLPDMLINRLQPIMPSLVYTLRAKDTSVRR